MNDKSQHLNIKEILRKDIWENFLLQCREKTFLQSWNWGEFQKTLGEKVWRFGIYLKISNLKSQNSKPHLKSQKLEDEKLIAITQAIGVKAKRGRFLLIPHGPIVLENNTKCQNPNVKSMSNDKCQILQILLNELIKIAKQEKCAFIRIAPIWERTEENEKIFRDLEFKQSPMHTHPELTWVLDLKPTEEELLKNMRKTTRYLIRQGLKNQDLKIIKSQDIKDIEIFNKLYQETAKRHRFTPFSLKYLQNEFLAFSSVLPQGDGEAVVFLAKYKGEFVASAIVIYWQGIGFYHQGASIDSKTSAAYLLQWETIKEAKKKGCQVYNFWGIADINVKYGSKRSSVQSHPEPEQSSVHGYLAPIRERGKKHPWAGLSLFKIGFGGYNKAYVKTQDYPVLWRYWLTRLFEIIRKKKRGF